MPVALVLAAALASAPAPAFVKILPGAPPPETARISTRMPADTDTGAVLPGTHLAVSGVKGTVPRVVLKADPLALLTRARRHETPAAVNARAYDLLPLIEIQFVTARTFHLGCRVDATLGDPAKPQWRARYLVWMFETYDRRSSSDLTAAAKAPKICLTEASRLFDIHAGGGMLPRKKPRVIELDGKRQAVFMVDAEPERAIITDAQGLIEYHTPIVVPPVVAVPEPVPLPAIVDPGTGPIPAPTAK